MRDRNRKRSHLLVHSSNGFSDPGWARPKPGAKSFFWVSIWVAETHALGPSFTAFLISLAERWMELEQPGQEFMPGWMLASQVAASLFLFREGMWSRFSQKKISGALL